MGFEFVVCCCFGLITVGWVWVWFSGCGGLACFVFGLVVVICYWVYLCDFAVVGGFWLAASGLAGGGLGVAILGVGWWFWLILWWFL